MKKKIINLYNTIPNWVKNRYFLSCFIFSIWIIFFDTNSIITQINQQKEITKIEHDINYYKEEIAKDAAIIKIISSDSLTAKFEKYLREVLFLSKENEEILIIE
tara:strand:+ start:215 stop:526 length:312 start_codon:yes stop_codon:yes gene_type:complete